jgi:hypothetical protein
MLTGMVAMTLRQPGIIVHSLVRGFAVAVVLGVLCRATLPVSTVALPLLGGASWAGWVSYRRMRASLRRADHVYVAAL